MSPVAFKVNPVMSPLDDNAPENVPPLDAGTTSPTENVSKTIISMKSFADNEARPATVFAVVVL